MELKKAQLIEWEREDTGTFILERKESQIAVGKVLSIPLTTFRLDDNRDRQGLNGFVEKY